MTPCGRHAVMGITDDSRAVTDGALFVAIRGELADGHRYCVAAAEKGAAVVCVEQAPSAEELERLAALKCGCLLVPDSLKAFHALASAHRQKMPCLIVGVTGSCGKTSMKEMCAAVLEAAYPGKVVKTEGNTNNYFGVPRNLFRLTADTKAAVIEMGSNHPGEIERLASMVKPCLGVISSIGEAHLEFFKDLAGVAEEKGDLLQNLPADGVAFIPAKAAHLEVLKAHNAERPCVLFGKNSEYLGMDENGMHCMTLVTADGRSFELKAPYGGQHMAENASAALELGLYLGLTPEAILKALAGCTFPAGRMEMLERGGIRWINDAYNANPLSMRASLGLLKQTVKPTDNLVIVLGDMLELGDCSACEHERLLTETRQMFPQARIITVGPRFAACAQEQHVECYADSAQAREQAAGTFAPGSVVFLKGSNSIRLPKLLPEE